MWRAALLLAVALLQAGCSFIFVRPPVTESQHQQPAVETKSTCTESVVAPSLDVAGAVAWSVVGGFAIWLSTDPHTEGNTSTLTGLAIGSLVLAAVEMVKSRFVCNLTAAWISPGGQAAFA